MSAKLVCSLLCLFLVGCTPLQPRRNIPYGFADECETEDCVIDMVDAIADDPLYPGERLEFTKGYKDANLRFLKETGRLEIIRVNPITTTVVFAISGIFLGGQAGVGSGAYGDVYSCKVWYTYAFGWQWLVHELTHCQGYKDRGPFANPGKYTPDQKSIMMAEGVDAWVDTEFYKSGEVYKYYTEK